MGKELKPQQVVELVKRWHLECQAEPVRAVVVPTGLTPSELAFCKNVISILNREEKAFWFVDPVDPVAMNLVGYDRVVKKKMDFTTIRRKLAAQGYKKRANFRRDVLLIFDNATAYNPKESEVWLAATRLKKRFEPLWARREAALTVAREKREQRFLVPQAAPAKNRPPVAVAPVLLTTARVMSLEEKIELGQRISMLDQSQKSELLKLISPSHTGNEAEIEIDMNDLSQAVLKQMQDLCEQQLGRAPVRGEKRQGSHSEQEAKRQKVSEASATEN